MRNLIALSFVVLALSACAETSDVRVKSEGYDVRVKGGDSHDGHHGTFCPPGQAKKGNC